MVKEILSNRFNININKEGATPPSNIQKEILSNTFSLNINKVGTIPPSGTQKEILSNTFSLNINKVQIQNKPPVITNLEYSLSERNCIINFNIFDEDNDKMNVYLIKNGQEELIFSNQSSGEKTITVYNLETGITTISIRVSDGKSNAYSEIFDVEIEGVVENRPPTITDVKHSVLGKNCTIDFNIHDLDGDKMDVYLIKNGKEELTLSKQTSGKKTISVNNLSTGNHIMSLKVSDGKLNTYSENFKVTIEEKEEIVNNPPTISNIKTSKTTALGSYELEFEIRDADNDKMDVYLKIDNSDYEPILINQSNGVKTYKGKGLSTGNHTCYIKVSDGKQEVISNSFNIRIPQTSNDNIFESIELITPTTIKANTPTRVAIKLKSKANIDKKTIHPKIKDIGNKVKIYNAQWEKGNVLTDWRESVSEISDKTSSIKVGLENITSTVETIQGDYVTSSQIEQLDNSWTAKFKDGYHEGITSIDKDGITVTSNGVKSKTSMSANGFKITKTDTGEDVFKVNSDGTLGIKGAITSGSTITGASISGGTLSIGSNFSVSSSGVLTAKSANFTGTINSGSKITGATISGGSMTIGNTSEGNFFKINSDGSFQAGSVDQWNYKATMTYGNSGFYIRAWDDANSKARTLQFDGDGFTMGNTNYGDRWISTGGGTLTFNGSISQEGGDFKTTGYAKANNFYLTNNSTSALRGYDASGNSVQLVHVGADNISKFGYGSHQTNTTGTYLMGGKYVAVMANNNQPTGTNTAGGTVYLCCNGAIPSDGGLRVLEFTKDSNDNYLFRHRSSGASKGVYLGSGSYRWYKLYSNASADVSSDRTLKENIEYIDGTVSNCSAKTFRDINTKDMYNFVKDDLALAKFNYIGHKDTEIGFIAQDLIYNADGTENKVGNYIVDAKTAREENRTLSYNTGNYTNVLAGALKQAIQKIEELEREVEELKCK